MQDIELERAIIAAQIGSSGEVTAVKVFDKADRAITRVDTQWGLTWGACQSHWEEQPGARMGMLFEIIWFLVGELGASKRAVNRAVMVLPEYREWRFSAR